MDRRVITFFALVSLFVFAFSAPTRALAEDMGAATPVVESTPEEPYPGNPGVPSCRDMPEGIPGFDCVVYATRPNPGAMVFDTIEGQQECETGLVEVIHITSIIISSHMKADDLWYVTTLEWDRTSTFRAMTEAEMELAGCESITTPVGTEEPTSSDDPAAENPTTPVVESSVFAEVPVASPASTQNDESGFQVVALPQTGIGTGIVYHNGPLFTLAVAFAIVIGLLIALEVRNRRKP